MLSPNDEKFTSVKECLIPFLLAVLILGPLSFASYPDLKSHDRNSNENSIPQPRTILPWLTFFLLVVQSSVAFRQARIAERQISIVRWQQIATNRPKLVIRKPILLSGPSGDPRTFVIYDVVNNGGSDATGFRSKVVADVIGKTKYPYFGLLRTDEILNGQKLGPGETLTNTHISPCLRDKVDKVAEDIRLADEYHSIFVLRGIIQYTDENMTSYQTGFWREYDFSTGRFIRSSDIDYEYED